jgi:hypothetical protein
VLAAAAAAAAAKVKEGHVTGGPISSVQT